MSSDDDDVVGDVVNVAARLQTAAGAGQVLVGEATFRLVRLGARAPGSAAARPQGQGRAGQRVPPRCPSTGKRIRPRRPFVGRAGELERLLAVLDAAISERRARLASIVGSPGVGKTRLARELAAAAADRARVVDVRCEAAGGATFAPIAAALRQAASLDDDASPETIVAALTALFDEDEPDRDRVAAGAAVAPRRRASPGLPEETFWAVRRLIENAARRGPIVFFFDDVHWAEPLLLDLIENVAEWTRDVPGRPRASPRGPSCATCGRRWSRWAAGCSAAIHLEGLEADESRRLTRELRRTAPTCPTRCSTGSPRPARATPSSSASSCACSSTTACWSWSTRRWRRHGRPRRDRGAAHASTRPAGRPHRPPRPGRAGGARGRLGGGQDLLPGRRSPRSLPPDLAPTARRAPRGPAPQGARRAGRHVLARRAGAALPPRADPRCRLPAAAQGDPGRPPRAGGPLARGEGRGPRRARRRHRLPARAGPPPPGGGRRARASRSAGRPRTAWPQRVAARSRPTTGRSPRPCSAGRWCASPRTARTGVELLIERCEALLAMGDATEAAGAVAELSRRRRGLAPARGVGVLLRRRAGQPPRRGCARGDGRRRPRSRPRSWRSSTTRPGRPRPTPCGPRRWPASAGSPSARRRSTAPSPRPAGRATGAGPPPSWPARRSPRCGARTR